MTVLMMIETPMIDPATIPPSRPSPIPRQQILHLNIPYRNEILECILTQKF